MMSASALGGLDEPVGETHGPLVSTRKRWIGVLRKMSDEELAAVVAESTEAEARGDAAFLRQIHRKRRLEAERELRRRERG
jgi:hypothetical protein